MIKKSLNTHSRKDWEPAFRKIHQQGDNTLLIDDVFEDEEFED
jgi:antitoxin MazE